MNEPDELFAAMGSALTRWSMVDRALTMVYAVVVNPRKPAIAAASIWRVTGHNLKVEMTEEALEALFIEYPYGDSRDIRKCWKQAKKSMAAAVRGRNDLSHSAIYGVATKNGRKSVLKKDRETFRALRQNTDNARSFDASACKKVELDCFDAIRDLARLLRPLDDFYKNHRIVMREDDAFPERMHEMFTTPAARRRRRPAR